MQVGKLYKKLGIKQAAGLNHHTNYLKLNNRNLSIPTLALHLRKEDEVDPTRNYLRYLSSTRCFCWRWLLHMITAHTDPNIMLHHWSLSSFCRHSTNKGVGYLPVCVKYFMHENHIFRCISIRWFRKCLSQIAKMIIIIIIIMEH